MRKVIWTILFIIVILIAPNTYNTQANWEDYLLAKDRETLRDWESVLELECFLALDHAPLMLVADADGQIRLSGYCEDVAFQLRDRAEVWGRRLETELLTKYEVRKFYQISTQYEHMINKAIIGNEIWFVDKAYKKMWHVGYLD